MTIFIVYITLCRALSSSGYDRSGNGALAHSTPARSRHAAAGAMVGIALRLNGYPLRITVSLAIKGAV
jgi:hypothetical protein